MHLLDPLKNRRVILSALSLAFFYLVLQAYLLNISLVIQTVTGSFPSTYKITLLSQLFSGYFTMFPLTETLFTSVSAFLVGLNLTLIFILSRRNTSITSNKLATGSMGAIAFASTGCTGCGLTLLSFLGPSSGVLGIIFHSMLVQSAIITTLLGSVLYSLVRIRRSTMCSITP